MVSGSDYWTFFWSGNGTSSGVGTGCIKGEFVLTWKGKGCADKHIDPTTGECGCENSDGTFIAGSDSCT